MACGKCTTDQGKVKPCLVKKVLKKQKEEMNLPPDQEKVLDAAAIVVMNREYTTPPTDISGALHELLNEYFILSKPLSQQEKD